MREQDKRTPKDQLAANSGLNPSSSDQKLDHQLSAGSQALYDRLEQQAKLDEHDREHDQDYQQTMSAMVGNEDEGHWLFNRSNMIWLISLLVLGGVWGGLYHSVQVHRTQNVQVAKQVKLWQGRVDRLRAKNDRTIYLPKPGDVNLSPEQVKAVENLTSLFTQMTTFTGQTEYNSNFQLAKQQIKDQQFFTKYWQSPYDHGVPVVEAQNIRMKNIRTQVLITGPQAYTVIVTYIPYHSHSDLYQQKKLQTRSRIYYVKGTPYHWTHVEEAQDMQPNTQIYYDSDIES